MWSLFTFLDFDSSRFHSLDISDDEFAGIGRALLARLVARAESQREKTWAEWGAGPEPPTGSTVTPSDAIALSARLLEDGTGRPVPGQAVAFSLGGQTATAVTAPLAPRPSLDPHRAARGNFPDPDFCRRRRLCPPPPPPSGATPSGPSAPGGPAGRTSGGPFNPPAQLLSALVRLLSPYSHPGAVRSWPDTPAPSLVFRLLKWPVSV